MSVQIPAAASPQETELVLLRAQLQALAELAQLPPGDGTAAPDPLAADEVSRLRNLLAALLPALSLPAITPPAAAPVAAAPAPGMARIEAAMARLLQDLVQETARRIQAEADLVRARAALRNHGFTEPDAPARIPLAPRP